MTNRVAKNKVQLLHSEKLGKLAWLVHAFSTRHGGVSRGYGGNALNLGFTQQDTHAAVERNREIFLKELGVANGRRSWPLVSLRQIHSDLIHRVDGVRVDRMLAQPLAGDGMVTDTPGLLVAVQTADCLPIILADRKLRAVSVFHAGWRGTVKRIVEKGVGEMKKHFGSDPRNLVAAIGPGVQGCCYEVGKDVRTKFEAQFAYGSSLFREVKESDPVREKYPLLFLTARAPGHSELPVKLFLDLVEANRRQLLDAGVMAKNIEAVGPCTACHTELLFSYRAEKGVTGRLMAAAGISPEYTVALSRAWADEGVRPYALLVERRASSPVPPGLQPIPYRVISFTMAQVRQGALGFQRELGAVLRERPDIKVYSVSPFDLDERRRFKDRFGGDIVYFLNDAACQECGRLGLSLQFLGEISDDELPRRRTVVVGMPERTGGAPTV